MYLHKTSSTAKAS